MKLVISITKIKIRLTDERWKHIIIRHPFMADLFFEIIETVESPEYIYSGNFDELIAIKYFTKLNGKFVVVVYKELKDDGFIITAYKSDKIEQFKNRKLVWKYQN